MAVEHVTTSGLMMLPEVCGGQWYLTLKNPIGSTDGIFTYIYHKNSTKCRYIYIYTIYRSYGNRPLKINSYPKNGQLLWHDIGSDGHNLATVNIVTTSCTSEITSALAYSNSKRIAVYKQPSKTTTMLLQVWRLDMFHTLSFNKHGFWEETS